MKSDLRTVDVVVVGSGFAGAITARVLRRLGLSVCLLERGQHPRFALGESSTPLAAISLETLATTYRLPDLHALATHGRWSRQLPELGRGLKRGFTFHATAVGERLLVAASPDDGVADCHWLRSEVDAFLVRRAEAEGVVFMDRTRIDELRGGPGRWLLSGERVGAEVSVAADFLIDASGGGAFLARHLAAVGRAGPPLDTALVYGHFVGAEDLAQLSDEAAARHPPDPYPEDRAAVHYLLGEDGWMYVLPFDRGVGPGVGANERLLSAGFVLRRSAPAARDLLPLDGAPVSPEQAADLFFRLAARYPAIAALFQGARLAGVGGPISGPGLPAGYAPRLGHRLCRAAGPGWLLLPSTYAFTDPLFSTGIAWSLLGVERVGSLFASAREQARQHPEARGLERYADLLALEADHIDGLIRGAYLSMCDFQLFAPFALLYFAAASFHEALRRLRPAARPWPWEGFLGATDALVPGLLEEALGRLRGLPTIPGKRETAVAEFAGWMRAAIRPRDIAGLADPSKQGLYGVDFAPLVAGADLLGMTPAAVRNALPRLRS